MPERYMFSSVTIQDFACKNEDFAFNWENEVFKTTNCSGYSRRGFTQRILLATSNFHQVSYKCGNSGPLPCMLQGAKLELGQTMKLFQLKFKLPIPCNPIVPYLLPSMDRKCKYCNFLPDACLESVYNDLNYKRIKLVMNKWIILVGFVKCLNKKMI